jgi:hypothetical protein
MLGPAGVDRPVKTLPVRGSKSFRNDHIETLAQNFGCGITEDSLSPGVPDLDRSVATGDDDGVGSLLDDRLKQVEIRQTRTFQLAAFPVSLARTRSNRARPWTL